MKAWKVASICAGIAGLSAIPVFISKSNPEPKKPLQEQGCVFRTIFGEETSSDSILLKTPEHVKKSLDQGLNFLASAQQQNGGWGAGLHSRQDITDPMAVHTDPATTAMAAMAFMRSGSNLKSGPFRKEISDALNYLLKSVDNAPGESTNITSETGTQIQSKLGQNIDVILTAQFLSNILEYTAYDAALHSRTKKCLDNCVSRIQKAQDVNGSFKGSGWAGVLQTSLATSALESALDNGASVDTVALNKSYQYSTSNYDAQTGNVNTSMGAGIVLYSVSSTARNSAKQTKIVKDEVEKAKKDGRLKTEDKINEENLQKIGFSKEKAAVLNTAYYANTATSNMAQQNDVMSGFGNNGGEEFLSYMQTGESMIIAKDSTWTKWYDSMADRMIKIQNKNGSWSGHHCITSPVFCTATALMILSVNNDAAKLQASGKSTALTNK